MGKLANRSLIVGAVLLALMGCTSKAVKTVAAPPQKAAGTQTVAASKGSERSPQISEISKPRISRPRIDEVYPASFDDADRGQLSRNGTKVRPAGNISLDFKDADIRQVIGTILGDLLKFNYQIDPRVTGTVTLVAKRRVQREALLPILDSILAARGYTVIERDGVYRVLPVSDRAGLGAGGIAIASAGRRSPIRIYPLGFISAVEMQKVLKPLLPNNVTVTANSERNFIIVSGPNTVFRLVDESVDLFDVDQMSDQTVNLISLERANARVVAGELEKIFGTAGLKTKDTPLLQLIPIERLNAILMISRQPSYLNKAREWVYRLDRKQDPAEMRLYVYYVQHSKAQTLAKSLSGFIGRLDEDNSTSAAAVSAPSPVGGTNRPEGTNSTATPSGERTAQDTTISVDNERNALLISATPANFIRIEEALAKLDIQPLQVLIETTIFEISLRDELRFGVQYALSNGGLGITEAGEAVLTRGSATSVSNSIISPLISPLVPGFSFALQGSTKTRAIVDTLSALTEVNMLSSPNVIVQNNKPARLSVGDEVPIVTQTSTSTVTDNPQVVNSVQYRNTGVKLNVIPRVSAGGLVTLDIEQEVTDVSVTTSSTINSPTFLSRNLLTTVTVKSGDTVFLGGLIREDSTRSKQGIPLLHDLPLIGPLFGDSNNTTNRLELVLLIRPVIIASPQDAQIATNNMRQKFLSLLEREKAGVRQPRTIDPPGPTDS